MALLPTVTFGAKCAAPPVGLHRTNPHSAAVKEQQPQTALIRASVRTQPSNNGCSQNNCGGLSAKERKKAFMKRNSFIEMAKLHDLSGRITYISSHAKQEHLYEFMQRSQTERSGGNLPSVIRRNLKKRHEWEVHRGKGTDGCPAGKFY